MDTIQSADNKATEKLFEVANAGGPILGVRAAIIGKADINAKNADGNTPLLVATLRDMGGSHTDIIIELLAHGANPNIADTSGKTPLDHARKKKNAEAIEKLLAHKAKTGAKLGLRKESGENGSCVIMGGKRRRNRTNKKTRKANKKRHTVRRRR
uniref:Uncharacterized protein n=1 Tax=viral metagenome TaxID=1070528 RepID=A0A6C0DV91_9ZZZZ